jgi:hypothetical protein
LFDPEEDGRRHPPSTRWRNRTPGKDGAT